MTIIIFGFAVLLMLLLMPSFRLVDWLFCFVILFQLSILFQLPSFLAACLLVDILPFVCCRLLVFVLFFFCSGAVCSSFACFQVLLVTSLFEML
ncbi:MAG: hypothetical protein ACI8RD_014227 [Bacillariaceae sp.]|jgi:hypothetical protein